MIAGLVLGIVSVSFFWVPLIFIAGIIGIIFSVSGRKKALAENKSAAMGTAGLVLSIIGLVFGVIGTICTIVTCTTVGMAALMSPELWEFL